MKNMDSALINRAKIKVFGIGGGGGNAINNMISVGLEGVEFIAANTDFQVLERSLAPTKIHLGVNLTKGLGAGGNPEVGSKATQEDIDKIKETIDGSDMVFITAGLGGGTGTGGAPVVAQACKDMGVLTVAVVTKPFAFEGKVRHRNADEGMNSLQQVVDTLITIPNDRLLCLADRRATFLEMFKRADDVLLFAVKGISDLIINPGYINVDFADVKTVMAEMGLALMGTGAGRGENRAVHAAQQAVSSPLLEDISIHGAKAALINICAGPDLGMHEFEEASSVIHKEVDEDAHIILGMTIDPTMEDELRVTVIATGIGKMEQVQKVESLSRQAQRRIKAGGMVPEINYDYLQIPTVVRHRTMREEPVEEAPKKRTFLRRLTGGGGSDEEDLSIPTFIRRQAD
ncbi:MAG: cell division protein FtsZ [Desulforhabdus sp.]|jgi:cell division protein FtsZ|nr:cell division protein FtsZ [Desulforhabdus sp.]